ncbi:MAG: hypothetical protein ACLFPF_07905 [Halanaerobiales bacterium]
MNNKKKLDSTNYIIIDNQKIKLIKAGKTNNGQIYLSDNTYMYGELDSSFFDRKEWLILISSSSLFTDSFFVPIQARDKISELVRVKFINLLPVSEEDLYYSYYIDQQYYGNYNGTDQDEDSLFVVCFAVRKEVVDKVYRLVRSSGKKINYILPLPLLFYIYHRKRQREGHFESSTIEDLNDLRGLLYIDRYFDMTAFTICHNQGIYFRSCRLDRLNEELRRTIEYLKEHIEISELFISTDGSAVKADNLLELDGNEKAENIENESVGIQPDSSILNTTDKKDDFKQIIMGKKLSKLDIKSLNILTQLSFEKKKKRNKYRFIIYFLIFLFLAVNSLSFYMIYQTKENNFAFNREQLGQLEPAVSQLESIEAQIASSQEQIEIYNQILGNKQSYIAYIYELSNMLPEDIEINHLSFEDDRMIILDGSALSASGVMEALEDSKKFYNLEFMGGIVVEEGYERFRIAGDLLDE